MLKRNEARLNAKGIVMKFILQSDAVTKLYFVASDAEVYPEGDEIRGKDRVLLGCTICYIHLTFLCAYYICLNKA